VLDLRDLELRLPPRAHVLVLDCLHVLGRDGFVDDFVKNRCAADAALQDPRRSLPRPEPWNVDLLGNLVVGAVKVGLELVERHLDIDLDSRRAELLDGALQRLLLGIQQLAYLTGNGPRKRPSRVLQAVAQGLRAHAGPRPPSLSRTSQPDPPGYWQ